MTVDLHSRTPLQIAAILILDNGYGHGVLRGIGEYARAHPQLNVHKFAKTGRFEGFFLRHLQVDGMIVKVSHAEEEELLLNLRLPVVNISSEAQTPRLTTVTSDDYQVGVLAAQYFLRRRLRHLAYCGNISHQASLRRREGYIAGAEGRAGKIHLHVAPASAEMKMQPERTRKALAAWLDRLPKPAGVFAFSDFVAHEVASAAAEAGLRCPEDIALLGVGNDMTQLAFSPTEISSIELNTRQIGLTAAQQLTSLIALPPESRPAGRTTLIRPLKIVTRRSTDRYALQDETVSRALEYIRENAGNSIYVDAVARAAATSRRTLELRFRHQLGASIYQIVQRTHVDRAAELLARPELTLEEVAYLSGHENARHLCLAFRRVLNTTPTAHRRSLLGPSLSRLAS